MLIIQAAENVLKLEFIFKYGKKAVTVSISGYKSAIFYDLFLTKALKSIKFPEGIEASDLRLELENKSKLDPGTFNVLIEGRTSMTLVVKTAQRAFPMWTFNEFTQLFWHHRRKLQRVPQVRTSPRGCAWSWRSIVHRQCI